MPRTAKPSSGGPHSGAPHMFASSSTPAFRSRKEENEALRMKRSIGNDGQSASAPNAQNPAFLVGVKVFSKGTTAGPGTNPDTMVYVPCPHVLNPFVSDDARSSYGYVAGDSAFIVTITREFMLSGKNTVTREAQKLV